MRVINKGSRSEAKALITEKIYKKYNVREWKGRVRAGVVKPCEHPRAFLTYLVYVGDTENDAY